MADASDEAGDFDETQIHEYRCPTCNGRMLLTIEPRRRVLLEHAAPGCEESLVWGRLVGGAVVEVRHVPFSTESH